MDQSRRDPRVRRPWTVLAATFTAAHHGFELSSGIGLVGQPELGLAGATALWATQIPTWMALAAKGGRRWDRLFAVWSGAALGGAVVHFLIWPWRRSALGLPVLAEAEGLDASKLPAYNTLLYGWGVASVLSIALEVPPRDRRWALLGLAALPVLRAFGQAPFLLDRRSGGDQSGLVEPRRPGALMPAPPSRAERTPSPAPQACPLGPGRVLGGCPIRWHAGGPRSIP